MTSPLSSTRSQAFAEKDYASALAELQSRYGASGGFPMPTPQETSNMTLISGHSSTVFNGDIYTLPSLSYQGSFLSSSDSTSSTSSRFKALVQKIKPVSQKATGTMKQMPSEPEVLIARHSLCFVREAAESRL